MLHCCKSSEGEGASPEKNTRSKKRSWCYEQRDTETLTKAGPVDGEVKVVQTYADFKTNTRETTNRPQIAEGKILVLECVGTELSLYTGC